MQNEETTFSSHEHPLLAVLNDEQRRAVLTFHSPLLVLAGAGSGKTRTITHKLAWLIQEERVLPWQVLAMTFTNKAAGEMRERVGELLGHEQLRDAWVGTFHSICLRVLRAQATEAGLQPGFVVYDDGDQLTLLGRVLKELNISDKVGTPKRFQKFIDGAKNKGHGPENPSLPQYEVFDRFAVRVYAAYQARLKAANAVDFGDIIRLTVDLFRNVPHVLQRWQQRWHYVLVDEFQDTNAVQYALLRLLTEGRGNLCVVGDDDQSIYSWRGARVENILRFPEHYPGTSTVRLERNYRSTANIISAAGSVISRNRTRHPKTMWTDAEAGAPVEVYAAGTDREEAARVASRIQSLRADYDLKEVAIIYRTNAMSRVIEDALRERNLSYRIVGGLRFYDRAEIKDVIGYLRLLVNPADEVSLSRVINVPARKIGDKSVAQVLEFATARGIPALHAAAQLSRETNALGKKLQPFCALMDRLAAHAATADVVSVAQAVLDWSGYQDALAAEDSQEAEKRRENLRELLASMEEFREKQSEGQASVAAFLDQVALATSAEQGDAEGGSATLMTVHSAKGLEFDVVFFVGLEEGTLPHFNTLDSPRDIEEERRLCYVAMTRARKRLVISYARERRKFGGFTDSGPSRFLAEIPAELTAVIDPGRGRLDAWRTQGFSGQPGARWDSGPLGRPSNSHKAPFPLKAEPQQDEGVGPVVDRSFSQLPAAEHYVDDTGDEGPPREGMKVRHPNYGLGTILALRGQGADAKVDVSFPTIGTKTIIARFLTRA